MALSQCIVQSVPKMRYVFILALKALNSLANVFILSVNLLILIAD